MPPNIEAGQVRIVIRQDRLIDQGGSNYNFIPGDKIIVRERLTPLHRRLSNSLDIYWSINSWGKIPFIVDGHWINDTTQDLGDPEVHHGEAQSVIP